jgi:antitoxin component YwqK of YwqJK toxin-antitoxin module
MKREPPPNLAFKISATHLCHVTGVSRWWYPSGKLLRETTFEHSIRVAEKEWNERGPMVRDFVLKKEDPLFEILERSRELDKKKR